MREESEPSRIGADIIRDRMIFAAHVLPDIAVLRDKFVGLATKLASLQTAAKCEYERKQCVQARPAAAVPLPKRPASEAAGSSSSAAGQRMRMLKVWNKAKQEAAAQQNADDTVPPT